MVSMPSDCKMARPKTPPRHHHRQMSSDCNFETTPMYIDGNVLQPQAMPTPASPKHNRPAKHESRHDRAALMRVINQLEVR